VVQTITSSVSTITGSTQFGSTGSNTHDFTGSVTIDKSLYVSNNISTGSFPFSVSAVTEPYIVNTNSSKSLYEQAGTAITFVSRNPNYTGSSSFLISLLTYTSSVATNVYFGAVAGTTVNGPANFVIGRRTGTSTWNESLRIDTTGNIGIGTTNPGSRLTVRGTDSYSMLYLGISGSSSNNEAVGITFGSSTYDKARIVAYNENSGNAAGYLTLWTGGSPATTDITERMRITSGGDVGIGTTSPSEKLEVSGSLKIGNLKIQNVNGGSIGFNRNTADGTIYNSSYAAFQINGAYSGANYLDFQNYSSSGVYLGGFVLNNGKIGMGTTAPNTKLQILGSTLTVGDQSTYALGIGNSSGYDLTFGTDSSYSYIQSWTSKPLSINSQGNNVLIPNASTNIGIGTTNPVVKVDVVGNSTDSVKLRVRNTNVSGSAGIVLNPEGAGAGSLGDATVFYDVHTTAWVAGVDKSDSSKYKIANDVYGDFRANNFFTITTAGRVGIGTITPTKTLEVNGRMSTSAIVSGALIAGNIYSNISTSPSFIIICNLNNVAGFSLSGKINAASYTVWNVSDVYIRKDYNALTGAAVITGVAKSGCDFSVVDISYAGDRFIALRFTGNPEIDVLWTGYRLNELFASDGTATVLTSGVTVNSTYASY
jgi:hypothetical protein